MTLFDASEVKALEHDLGRVAGRVAPAIGAVTKKAAQNIKDGLVSDATSGGHYKYFSGSISYDQVFTSLTAFEYEIGPDKGRRQGALGNILYFGTSNNGPVLDLMAPVKREEPKFLAALAKAAEVVL